MGHAVARTGHHPGYAVGGTVPPGPPAGSGRRLAAALSQRSVPEDLGALVTHGPRLGVHPVGTIVLCCESRTRRRLPTAVLSAGQCGGLGCLLPPFILGVTASIRRESTEN